MGVFGAAWEVAKGVGREFIMPAAEKMLPQGASEISQALFTGSAYVPYGPTNESMNAPDSPAANPATPSSVAAPSTVNIPESKAFAMETTASSPAMEAKQPEIDMEMG